MAVLVAHASKHGSTEEIAAFVADRLRARGLDVALADTTEATIDGADAVVLLSGVYAGRWLGPATRFIRDHRDDLVHIDDLLEAVDPVEHWVVAGRISEDLLGFAERALVRALKVEVGDFRDWDEIGRVADAISDHLLP